jgi:hypothetical protein
MLRDREIKLRLYPSLSFVLIFPLLQVIHPDREGPGFTAGATFWMMGLIPVIAIEALRHSSQFAAGDLFRASPVPSIAPIFHGFRKAAMVFVLAPSVVIGSTLLFALLPDRRSLIETGLPALLLLPTLSLAPAMSGGYLPLSEPQVRGSSGRNVSLMMLSMIAMPILFGVGYLARRANLYWPALGIEAVLLYFIYRRISRRIASTPVPVQ